ncbi:MAG: hypothetical protein JHC93_08445 [Parachlamydiales bacterium]|nr:hypothetical protein [Parachlamydiales bacterium]
MTIHNKLDPFTTLPVNIIKNELAPLICLSNRSAILVSKTWNKVFTEDAVWSKALKDYPFYKDDHAKLSLSKPYKAYLEDQKFKSTLSTKNYDTFDTWIETLPPAKKEFISAKITSFEFLKSGQPITPTIYMATFAEEDVNIYFTIMPSKKGFEYVLICGGNQASLHNDISKAKSSLQSKLSQQ